MRALAPLPYVTQTIWLLYSLATQGHVQMTEPEPSQFPGNSTGKQYRLFTISTWSWAPLPTGPTSVDSTETVKRSPTSVLNVSPLLWSSFLRQYSRANIYITFGLSYLEATQTTGEDVHSV